MPAPKLLAGLPKPVLIGFYGAIGGLLGALLFGEPILWALKPRAVEARPAPQPEPRLAVTASKELQIYQGGTNKLIVQILRDEFEGEVTVRIEGLPPGISAREAKIPQHREEVEIELFASANAVAGPPTAATVIASAQSGGKVVRAESGFQLTTLASPMPQVDIMFVLDVTGSMQNQIDGLKEGIGTFSSDLFREKVDARFGCVAFRDLFVKEPQGVFQMRVLQFKDEHFTSDAGVFRDEVGKLIASGGGDQPETSFEAITAAASINEWRKSAVRTLILITDAPPKIVVQRGQSKEETIESLRKNNIDFLHLVVNQHDVPIYRDIQAGAVGSGEDKSNPNRGTIFDLAAVARDKDVMTTRLLPEMTRAIVASAESKRPESKPELTKRPDEKPQLPIVKAVQSGEDYEKSDALQLVAAVSVWTGGIAALVCLFLLAGQHHYLRGTLPASGSIAAALVGGLVVGMIGGSAGQGLFMLADTSNSFVEGFFRVIGWTILGSLAGLGLSLFVPNLKLKYGLLGGAIGGAAGAVGFIIVQSIAGAVLGRLAGGLVLGCCIGLMVAVVEAAFRRAWLEVRYGPREVVTVNLGAEPVKVGSDSRACTVWARGAAEVQLRYYIRDGKVICTDMPSRTEAVVQDGDSRTAGNVTVLVRTSSSAAVSTPPQRPSIPQLPKKTAESAKPLDLPEDDGLPQSVATAVKVPAAKPQPASTPVPAPAANRSAPRDPDACPGCGRKVPGRPGTRYCMVCDQTY